MFVQIMMAQTDANLTGRVEDQAGAIVAGATVTATNTDTGVAHSVKPLPPAFMPFRSCR